MEKSVKTKLIKRITAVAAAAVFLAVSVLAYGQITFGWFFSSQNVSGGGMGAQSQLPGNLQIRAKADGADISVERIVAEMDVIEDAVDDAEPDPDGKKYIYPGVSGSFTFYVHDGSETAQTAYSFSYSIVPKNNEFTENGGDKGFYHNVSDENKQQALWYLSSHVLFFKNKTDGVFSGWISPESVESVSVPDGPAPAPYAVTVHWVWIERYEDVFSSDRGIIDEATRSEIAAYYSEESNASKMTARGEQSADAFNEADTFIGITVKYICFEIEVK
ncbi:MAG: hypothetical protein ACI4SC_03520 [Candidatus Neoclostridium sp.]